MKEFMRKQPLLVALVCLAIGLIGIRLPISDVLSMTILRYVLSAIMICALVIMGGGDTLYRITEGAGHTLRKSIYPLVLAFLMGAVVAALGLLGGNFNIEEGLLAEEIKYIVFAFSVGLFEESLFRGIIFGSLLIKLGGTRKGIMRAAVISSLVFGSVHVLNYIFGGSYDVSGIVQSLLKTLQSGALGMLLAALYMKNKNLWAIALVHALNDFFVFQASVLSNTPPDRNYVFTGGKESAQGVFTIGVYAITILFYIPMIISAVRIIKKQELPEFGIFKE